MRRRFSPNSRFRLPLWGSAAALLSGGYLLFPNPINGTVGSLGRNVVVPVANYVSGMVIPPLNRIRREFVNLGELWSLWAPGTSENFRIKREEEGFFRILCEGNRQLLISTKNMLVDLSRFMFVQLPRYIDKYGLKGAAEHLSHYLRPLKLLFSRPELERLQSHKSRLDQFVNAFRNPRFPSTLASMNGFYLRFREQMEALEDGQLAELIDIFLEDPEAMKRKVDLIMEKMGEDEELIRRNFDVDLLMDFVRGENIDRIKAKIAASKVSSELNGFLSLFSGVSSKYDKSNLIGEGGIDESVEGFFVSTVT